MTEALYTLGPKGEAFMETKGMDVRGEQSPRKQLAHFVGINDLRIAVECSSRPVGYFFAAWELASLGWSTSVIPDAVFAVDDAKRKTFLAEYDRSTEPIRLFAKKLRLYQEGVKGFQFDAVLVLTKTKERILSLHRHLRGRGLPPGRYFATPSAEILNGDLWSKAFIDLANLETELGAILVSNRDLSKCSHKLFSRGNSFK